MDYQPWFCLLLTILATWRVTHLLTYEDGPGDIFVALRKRLGNGFWGRLMDCFYCMSLWIAAPIAYLLMNRWRDWPILWLAFSGAACLLERLSNPSSLS